MNKVWLASTAVLCATMGVAWAADEVQSGLQVGDSTKPYNVRDITGPNKGKTLCYR
jgi:hypothetical protein